MTNNDDEDKTLVGADDSAASNSDLMLDLSEMTTLADRIDSILDQSTPEHSRTSAGSHRWSSPWRHLSPDGGSSARSPSPSGRSFYEEDNLEEATLNEEDQEDGEEIIDDERID